MEKRKCKKCNKIFYAFKSRTKKFCSHKCFSNSRIGIKRNLDFKGDKNPNWKGGKIKDKDGYIMLYMPEHPQCNGIGYIREHRFKMEQKLGRLLKETEVIHHKNGIRDDNRLSNLELLDKKDHDRLEYYKRGGLKK